MNIGSEIRKLRKENKLSLKELGAMIGVSEQAISQYERNIRSVNIQTLLKIAKALNVSLETFVKVNDFDQMKSLAEEFDAIDKLLISYGYKVHHISCESLNEQGKLILKEDGSTDDSRNPEYSIESEEIGKIVLTADEYDNFRNTIEIFIRFELHRLKNKR